MGRILQDTGEGVEAWMGYYTFFEDVDRGGGTRYTDPSDVPLKEGVTFGLVLRGGHQEAITGRIPPRVGDVPGFS